MKLLSLLVCLAMMISCVCMAEEPAAPATVVTVRDAVVRYMDEEYPLNPTIALGAIIEENSALIDFGMPLGENTLFPVQAKIDENGLGVLLGQSDTAYTFTPEFFDSLLEGEEIPEEAFHIIDAYMELLSAASNIPATATAEQNDAMNAKLLELIGDVSGEEATFYANDQEQTGEKFALSLNHDQMMELLNVSFEMMPEDYLEAYYNYMSAAAKLSGGPEITSYEDIMAMAGMTMSIDGEVISNETSAVADLVMHITVDPNAMAVNDTAAVSAVVTDETAETAEPAEPVTMDLPMTVTVHTPEHVECLMTIEDEGMSIDMTVTQQGSDVSVVAYASDESDFAMQMAVTLAGYGTDASSVLVSIVAEDPYNMFGFSSETGTADGVSTTDVEFNYDGEGVTLGASFSVDVGPGEITDRIASAAVSPIASLEDAEGSTGLMPAAMSMMSDVEKLMNDESVAALVNMVTELSNTAASTGLVVGADTTGTTVEIDENGSEIAAVSAPVLTPEFGWLPEGYALTEAETHDEGYYSSYVFDSTAEDDEYHSSLYIDIMNYLDASEDGPQMTTYTVSDGAIQPVSGAVVSVQRYDDGSIYGHCDDGSVSISLSYYDSDLTDEDIVKILSGITFTEAAE